MKNYTTVVGLDVHKNSIVAAVLPAGADSVTERVTIENNPKTLAKMVNRIAGKGRAEFVYEAGPCGYDTYRQITGLGHPCAVIAPALTPVRPGDKVKTDRRDAEKLARYYRAGELTEIRIPDAVEEAARDLVRVREDAVKDHLRARHRLSKFLTRQGRVYRETRQWGTSHQEWLRSQRFEQPHLQSSFEAYMRAYDDVEARLASLNLQIDDLAKEEPYKAVVGRLRCLKGIDTLSAITLAVETQDFRRFTNARAYMSFTGLVGSEFSSAEKIRRGSITKAGNAHIRRILIESAWSYRGWNVVSVGLAKRREGCSAEVLRLAKRAQERLHRKFKHMTSRGKQVQTTVVAVARELAGFIWAIAQAGEKCPT